MKVDYNKAASDLIVFYHSSFGGKIKGRYKIKREHLSSILKINFLKNYQIEELQYSLLDRGFIIINLDMVFIVMTVVTFNNYRSVPKSLIGGEHD